MYRKKCKECKSIKVHFCAIRIANSLSWSVYLPKNYAHTYTQCIHIYNTKLSRYFLIYFNHKLCGIQRWRPEAEAGAGAAEYFYGCFSWYYFIQQFLHIICRKQCSIVYKFVLLSHSINVVMISLVPFILASGQHIITIIMKCCVRCDKNQQQKKNAFCLISWNISLGLPNGQTVIWPYDLRKLGLELSTQHPTSYTNYTISHICNAHSISNC